MKLTHARFAEFGGASNDEIAAQIAASRRSRIWKVVFVLNAVALIAAIAGCLMMLKSQGVKSDVAQMRDEIGEILTTMTLNDANEAISKHIPRLVDATDRWEGKFGKQRMDFRGMDIEINQVQEMVRLGKLAYRWRLELECVSPPQRNDSWQKGIKAQVEAEQKKWPNRTGDKGIWRKLSSMGNEFWFGAQFGVQWPYGLYSRTAELLKSKRSIGLLELGDCLRYVLFPYRLSAFTMLWLAGIVCATSGVGYLLCWIGLKPQFGGLSYVGLLYFFYLLIIVLYILGLEILQ